jgi:hypothetical protein
LKMLKEANFVFVSLQFMNSNEFEFK